jgi:hypothetical protein
VKWTRRLGGGMWAPPDPNHKPEFHTARQDIQDLGRFVGKCVAWGLGTLVALAALLLALALVFWAIVAAANLPVPTWAWLVIIPLFGIWWQLSCARRDGDR